MWQLPVPVSITGIRDFSMTVLIKSAPPLGIKNVDVLPHAHEFFCYFAIGRIDNLYRIDREHLSLLVLLEVLRRWRCLSVRRLSHLGELLRCLI